MMTRSTPPPAQVAPQQGACLLFFPAYENGEADLRMEHSGEVVKKGTKYILNTWVCEVEANE